MVATTYTIVVYMLMVVIGNRFMTIYVDAHTFLTHVNGLHWMIRVIRIYMRYDITRILRADV